MPATVMPCTCSHPFQDQKYGLGRRVHNYSLNSNNKQGGWRCTVCKVVKAGKKKDTNEPEA